MTALIAMAIGARADYPAESVKTSTVAPGQPYPGVDANSEKWFDIGGFCKVVGVGDLSTIAPGAQGIPVFIPGPAAQWENYRSLAPGRYGGQLTLTTCCRPQTNIATLCASATNPQPVDREYGRVGEIDTVSATCSDPALGSYTETMSITCSGDNGPDGQASWSESADAGVPAGPQCPSMTVMWEEDETIANTRMVKAECVGTLPATSAGQTGTAAAIPEYVRNVFGVIQGNEGSYSLACKATGSWASDTTVRHSVDGFPQGTCARITCDGMQTWTVNGFTCTADGFTPNPVQEGQSYTAYTIDTTASKNDGAANFTCNADGSSTLQPGATCGPGQCKPVSGIEIIPPGGGCGFDCLEEITDNCGNLVRTVGCSGGACTPPPPPPTGTQPTYCAPGTVFTSCQLQTYQCLNTNVTYDDCGNECSPANQAWPSVQQSTWGSPTCGNGSECQYGYTLCYTNTLFSGAVFTSAVCSNSDGAGSCP